MPNSVTKSEIIERLHRLFPNMEHTHMTLLVELVFDAIILTLATGNRVELRDFGTFTTRERAPRMARNPRTNAKVKLGTRHVCYFRPGKKLRLAADQLTSQ